MFTLNLLITHNFLCIYVIIFKKILIIKIKPDTAKIANEATRIDISLLELQEATFKKIGLKQKAFWEKIDQVNDMCLGMDKNLMKITSFLKLVFLVLI
jgi:hypothetical protein